MTLEIPSYSVWFYSMNMSWNRLLYNYSYIFIIIFLLSGRNIYPFLFSSPVFWSFPNNLDTFYRYWSKIFIEIKLTRIWCFLSFVKVSCHQIQLSITLTWRKQESCPDNIEVTYFNFHLFQNFHSAGDKPCQETFQND